MKCVDWFDGVWYCVHTVPSIEYHVGACAMFHRHVLQLKFFMPPKSEQKKYFGRVAFSGSTVPPEKYHSRGNAGAAGFRFCAM